MKNKNNLKIDSVNKVEAWQILNKYHYLKDYSKSFKSGINFGLYDGEELIGVCIFTGLPVPEIVVGAFGLERTDQVGFFELSRFCLTPMAQMEYYNLSTWFLARCIKRLKQKNKVRAILSYADADFHVGKIYQASNFKYYGLSDPKKDFWIKQNDGSYIKHNRGKIKGVEGEWRPRTRKHRYLLIYDNRINCRWETARYPNN